MLKTLTKKRTLKITQEIISNTICEVLKREDKPNYPVKLYLVEDAVQEVVNRFYWIPTFKLLKSTGLIDDDLNPGGLMLEHDFLKSFIRNCTDAQGDRFVKEEFYITSKGHDFLMTLIDTAIWAYREQLPDRIRYATKKY